MQIVRLAYMTTLVVAACGGGQSQTPPPQPAGESHATPAAPDGAQTASGEPATATAPPPVAQEPTTPPPLPAGTTIELKNDGEGDLVFSTTKGWQPVIFAYTGKPPKAKSVMLFPGYCTASCDAGEAQVCPTCPAPKNKKEELAMRKSETAGPGGSVRVPWDGKVFVYDKSPGKKHCRCWKKVDPPADTYTIKACGLRPSKEAGKPSKPVCTETQATLGGGLPASISLSFAK